MITDNIRISSVKRDDYENIIKFLSKFENETRNAKFWKNRLKIWWEKNPAFTNKIKRGWILKDLDKNLIVGFIANIPTFFQIGGKKIIVNNGSTFRVKKEYRMHSINLYLKWVNYSDNTIHFSTTPTKVVEIILKSLKFEKFPKTPEFINNIPINLHSLFKYKYIENDFLIKTIKIFRYFPFYFYYFSFKSFFIKNFKVKIIKKVGKNFDELWSRTKDKYLNTTYRDSKYINWYCDGKFNQNKIIFGLFNEDKLEAYFIFHIKDGKYIRSLNCLDIWGNEISTLTLKLILFEVLKFSKKNNLDIIEFPYFNSEVDNYYKKIRFFKRKHSFRRYYKVKGDLLKNTDFNKRTFLTFAQGDIGL